MKQTRIFSLSLHQNFIWTKTISLQVLWVGRQPLLNQRDKQAYKSLNLHAVHHQWTYSFMTTALEGGEGSASRPSRSLPPGNTRYPLNRRLGGPQGRSGQVRKISPPPGFDLRTVQPVASRYTDYATRPTPRCKRDRNSFLILAAKTGIFIPTFRDNLSVPSPKVKQSKKDFFRHVAVVATNATCRYMDWLSENFRTIPCILCILLQIFK